MNENEVIEILNEDEPEIEITRNEIVYAEIPEEVIEEMQEDIANLQENAGTQIDLELNSSTYILTAKLKNGEGTIVSSDTVDFHDILGDIETALEALDVGNGVV